MACNVEERRREEKREEERRGEKRGEERREKRRSEKRREEKRGRYAPPPTGVTSAQSTARGSTAAIRSRKKRLLEVLLSFRLRIVEVLPDPET